MTVRSYLITTLGCRVNRADSISMEREFADAGFRKAGPGEVPDVWVVNTCAVTAEGMRKSRKAVRKCAQSGADIIVTGCAPELEPATFQKTTGVHAVVKNSEKSKLVSIASELEGRADQPIPWRCDELVRVPIKVQDGCERFCTYCVVPYMRGKPGSRALPDVIRDVRELRDTGAGEVVICGIDLGSYRDPKGGAALEDLVERVIENAGDMWVRLSSIELSDVNDRLLEMMSEENVLRKYLHVPLQSGDDSVLAEMGRNYSPEWFRRRVAEIRDAVPDAGISTDVIVGFPTESEEAFEGTRSLMEDIGFSRAHVFRYSPRPLTAAFFLGDPIDSATKGRRAEELRRIARESAVRFHRGLVGRIILVLVEGTMEGEAGSVFGRAENFGVVIINGDRGIVGKKIPVRVTGLGPRWLRGEPAEVVV
ncbi:MAG: MiaB/RimO family radical SAM methylthiotransferase [Actinobacteria bacterium]|nr:MiaB/RimO family radical SAM methylthiotransferase [Actinomycetota bacterium]